MTADQAYNSVYSQMRLRSVCRASSFVTAPMYTLFLFTKSDIKMTVVPITFFALAAAPELNISHFHHTVLWIWLHLLQFDVSNQTLHPEEDEENKKDRPLPLKRITLRHALILRWLLIPTCCAYSLLYSAEAFFASVMLIAFTILYNELSAHAGHWLLRNVVNALGFASFEVGSTLIASADRHILDSTAILSVCISAGIFATTIQAQDFKDVHGDRAIGRHTLPIVSPSIARYTVLAGLLSWSVGLVFIWKLNTFIALPFIALAIFIACRFLIFQTVHEDQISFYWYNVWLSLAHSLPGYYRFFQR